jgi:hypothetical protein
MRRTQRIYKYECPDCGWIAFRAELEDGMMCSKCGCLDKPIVSTEDRTYEIDDDMYKEFSKAREYARRLTNGEDPARIDADLRDEQEGLPMLLQHATRGAVFPGLLGSQKIY